MFSLGRNLGYEVEGVHGTRLDDDFSEKRRAAWDVARAAIDDGLPCYGWELDIPEYYVVYGYDDEGYYFSGALHDAGGPKPWRSLADGEIGVIEMYAVRPGRAVDDVRTVKEALEFALEHAQGAEKWTFPNYGAGLAGYDNWIRAVEAGTADGWGMAYNSACWAECRGLAVQFLREAEERLKGGTGPLLVEAAKHYQVVHQSLKQVAELFPFPPEDDEVKETLRCSEAAGHLRAARKAEESGLKTLESVVKVL